MQSDAIRADYTNVFFLSANVLACWHCRRQRVELLVNLRLQQGRNSKLFRAKIKQSVSLFHVFFFTLWSGNWTVRGFLFLKQIIELSSGSSISRWLAVAQCSIFKLLFSLWSSKHTFGVVQIFLGISIVLQFWSPSTIVDAHTHERDSNNLLPRYHNTLRLHLASKVELLLLLIPNFLPTSFSSDDP